MKPSKAIHSLAVALVVAGGVPEAQRADRLLDTLERFQLAPVDVPTDYPTEFTTEVLVGTETWTLDLVRVSVWARTPRYGSTGIPESSTNCRRPLSTRTAGSCADRPAARWPPA